jgi:hypothetical protein
VRLGAEAHHGGMASTGTFQYIQCDIPEGVSIREWRDTRVNRMPRRRRVRSIVRRARREIGF